MLGWTVSCSFFWVNIDTTRYSATEFGRNKPTNFRLSGTLKKPLFSKATMVMRFPAKKNAGCPKAPRDFPPRKDGILLPSLDCLWDSPPPPPKSVRAGRWTYADVTTTISPIDRLPDFLSYPWSSA